MSLTITESFVNNYSKMLFELSRQKGSRLRQAVRQEPITGDQAFYERIDTSPAVPMGARHSSTPFTPSEHSRRRLVPSDWVWNDYLDKMDKIKLLTDPTSAYTEAAIDSLGQRTDMIIIEALGGNAFSGQNGATAVALPAEQIIVNGATGFTMAKLREAKYRLDRQNVKAEGRYITISAKGLMDLLAEPNLTSADYNTVKTLVDGQINTFMGFTFIHSELLANSNAGQANNIRSCFAWQRDGMMLGIGQDVNARVSELPERNYSIQAYASMSLGSTRLEEKRVVKIDITEPQNF